ncbi:MAG: hypothetical protein JWO31_1711 [Phycisphaerales bacterium]|nr:hypothetical protein [Phycisphaerales bacterium]
MTGRKQRVIMRRLNQSILCGVGAAVLAQAGAVRDATAAIVAVGAQRSIASSGAFPATTGTHFHSNLGQPDEVGSFSSSEEVRGVGEFDLAAQPLATSATLSFSVSQLGSSYFGQTGPGNYTIGVFAYLGDNTIDFGDYSATSIATLGSFGTSALTAGQTLSFNATAAYNAAALSAGKSLGIRLQPLSDPGTNVANQFSGFQVNAVPEPASAAAAGLAGAGLLAGRRRRLRA